MEILFFIFIFHNIYICFFLSLYLIKFIECGYLISTFFLYLLLLSFCLVILSWNSAFNDTFCNWGKNNFFDTFPIKTSVASVSFWNFVKIIFFEKILDFFFFILNFSRSFLIRFYFYCNICIISTAKFFTFFALHWW